MSNDDDSTPPSVPDAERRAEIIELDARSRAFYAGVAAGVRAQAKLEELRSIAPDTDPEALAAFYWLVVGAAFPEAVPGEDADEQGAFVTGAATRAPQRPRPAFELLSPSFDARPFTNAEDEPLDEETLTRRVVTALQRTWIQLSEGGLAGDVLLQNPDTGGLTSVGTYRLDTT